MRGEQRRSLIIQPPYTFNGMNVAKTWWNRELWTNDKITWLTWKTEGRVGFFLFWFCFCFFCFAEMKSHSGVSSWLSSRRVTCPLAICALPRQRVMWTIFLSRWLSARQHSGLKNDQLSWYCWLSVTQRTFQKISVAFPVQLLRRVM